MSSALVYLDKAVKAITPLGFAPTADQPIVALVSELQAVDESKALVVAKTLAHSSVFNEAVRSQIADMSMGQRYESITSLFDSILEDSKSMLKQIEENRNGFKEKVGRFVMKLTRGSINSRFGKIKSIYLTVTSDTKDQLNRERVILEAYLDYRGALKEAEIVSAQMLKIQAPILQAAKLDLATKNDLIAGITDPEAKSRAQLVRDEAERTLMTEDRRYQLVKEVSEQLSIAYNVGDTVIANLNQTRSIKQAVYDKAIIFFTTNESVFTSLDANLTSTAGLNESRRAVDALSDGMNRGLETLAEVGSAVKMEAIKTAYGTNIKAASVAKLIDSLVSFQQDSIKAIAELRVESAKNTVEIAKIVDDGKDKFAKLVTA